MKHVKQESASKVLKPPFALSTPFILELNKCSCIFKKSCNLKIKD